MDWKITSSQFAGDQMIPAEFTCDGRNVSPPLRWTAPPSGTRELALIVDDPDAPIGVFTHWVLYNLPADRTELPEGVAPEPEPADVAGARQGVNDFGGTGYGGPCPPRGQTHHYRFTLYALDRPVKLAAKARKSDLERAMRDHVLARTELVGLYKRKGS